MLKVVYGISANDRLVLMGWQSFGMNFSTTSSKKEVEGVQQSASEVLTILLAELMSVKHFFFSIGHWAQAVIERATAVTILCWFLESKWVWCDVYLSRNCMRSFSIPGWEKIEDDYRIKVTSQHCHEMEFNRNEPCDCITMVLRPSKHWLEEKAGWWHVFFKPSFKPFSVNLILYDFFFKIWLILVSSYSAFYLHLSIFIEIQHLALAIDKEKILN